MDSAGPKAQRRNSAKEKILSARLGESTATATTLEYVRPCGPTDLRRRNQNKLEKISSDTAALLVY
jgi:hypothetical protein